MNMEVGINDYYEPEHYRALCEDDYNVSRTREDEPNSMHHIHNSCEILFCESGAADYYIRDNRYSFESGDIIVIGSMNHHVRNIKEFPYQRYGLTISPSYARRCIYDQELLKVLETPDPAEYEKRFKNIDKDKFEELIELLRKLYGETLTANPMKPIMERSIIMEIIVKLYRVLRFDELANVPMAQGEKMQAIKEYINEHYAESISLESLADIFYMHSSNISKYFHEYCGFTLSQYVNTVRVCEAQRLLESTDLSISIIAEKTGFGSVNNFIRRYREILSKTPLQYRKEYLSYINRKNETQSNNTLPI